MKSGLGFSIIKIEAEYYWNKLWENVNGGEGAVFWAAFCTNGDEGGGGKMNISGRGGDFWRGGGGWGDGVGGKRISVQPEIATFTMAISISKNVRF